MLKKLMLIAVLSGVAAAAHADDRWQVKEAIQLRDGTTLYVFQDGKMGMQNRWGRAVSGTPGHTMETVDGRKITMVGDEVSRIEHLNGPQGAS